MSKWKKANRPPIDNKSIVPKTLREFHGVELNYPDFNNPFWNMINNIKPGYGVILRNGRIYTVKHNLPKL